MRNMLLGSGLALAIAAHAFGESSQDAPRPGYRRLGYFIGTWNGEGLQRPNALGAPSGPWLGSMTCGPFEGGFHVVCNVRATIGGAASRELAIFGYDLEQERYTWFDIDNTGMNALATGSVEGSTWTFLFDMKAGGKSLRLRVGLVEQSSTTILNQAHVSVDGAPWELLVEAKFSKAK